MKVVRVGKGCIESREHLDNTIAYLNSINETSIVVTTPLNGVETLLTSIADSALQNQFNSNVEALRERHIIYVKGLINLSCQSDALIHIQTLINELTTICQSIYALQELSSKSRSRIIAIGHELIADIVCRYLQQSGLDISKLSGDSIITDRGYLNGEVSDFSNINRVINQSSSYVIAGSIAVNGAGERTLLGEKGEDFTASIYANAVDASSIELIGMEWGISVANRDVVAEANPITIISYKEAFELMHWGADFIYPLSMRPAMLKDIPINIRTVDTLNKIDSTISSSMSLEVESSGCIKGIASVPNISIVTVSGVGISGMKGSARRVFTSIEDADVNVVFISQCCSEHSICIGVDRDNHSRVREALQQEFVLELERGAIDPITEIEDLSVVAIVGDNMRNVPGISAKAFSALGHNDINIRAIAQGASERNISIIVDKCDEKSAILALHNEFFR